MLAGGPITGSVAVDSTEVTGGAGGGAAREEPAGGVLTGVPGVLHTVSVTVTVTGEAREAVECVKLGYENVTRFTYYPGEYRWRRRRRQAPQRREP